MWKVSLERVVVIYKWKHLCLHAFTTSIRPNQSTAVTQTNTQPRLYTNWHTLVEPELDRIPNICEVAGAE